MMEQPVERRNRQRIATAQEGMSAFWLECEGERVRVLDLSLEGCGVSAEQLPGGGKEVRFIMLKEGSSSQVRGQLLGVNRFMVNGAWQSGCRFVSFEADGYDVLWAWLTRHVLDCASVPLRLEEAEGIVAGPSII